MILGRGDGELEFNMVAKSLSVIEPGNDDDRKSPSDASVMVKVHEYVRGELKELEERIMYSIRREKEDTEAVSTRLERAVEQAGNHRCIQTTLIDGIRSDVSEIKNTVNWGRKLKVGVILTGLGAILSAAVFLFNMQTRVEVTQVQVRDMKEDVVLLQSGNQRLEDALNKQIKDRDDKYNAILNNLNELGSKLSDDSSKYKRRDGK